MLLGSLVRCPLAVRIEGRVVSFLTLRTGCTAFGKRADHRVIPLVSPALDVFRPLWTVLGCSASKECNQDIARRSLDNSLPMLASCSDCLRMASAMRSRSVNGITDTLIRRNMDSLLDRVASGETSFIRLRKGYLGL